MALPRRAAQHTLPAVNAGGIIAVAFLVVMIGLVLWGVRGHPRVGDGSGNQYGPGPDDSGTGTGLGGD